ncbi:hypothetical protein F0562_022596 [Nyssa sinensis]|uniref:Uncharacterized protein n=1 Tax=Nyssa sinensis TaxID=561372 RepID=A0A5J5BN82_9ASTE|nr:hypothetical protein F0562_022596 [Nyssa sinensis]
MCLRHNSCCNSWGRQKWCNNVAAGGTVSGVSGGAGWAVVGLIQAPDIDLQKQVLSGFRLLRNKRTAASEPTTSILAKRVALGDSSSSERTAMEDNVQNPSTLSPELPSLTKGANIAETSTPSSKRRGKEITNSEQRGEAFARTLGEDSLPLPSIRDALKMAWDLS